MGIASIARTEQVEVATTCRKFATSDLGIVNCDEISMCLLSGRTTRIDRVRGGDLPQVKNSRSSTSVQCFVRASSPTRTQHRGTRTRNDLV
jgi:hypothetical protein